MNQSKKKQKKTGDICEIEAVIEAHNKFRCAKCQDKKTHWLAVPGMQAIPSGKIGSVIGRNGQIMQQINKQCKKGGLATVYGESGAAFGHVHAKSETCQEDINTIRTILGKKIQDVRAMVDGAHVNNLKTTERFMRQRQDAIKSGRRVDTWLDMGGAQVDRKAEAIRTKEYKIREYTNTGAILELQEKAENNIFAEEQSEQVRRKLQVNAKKLCKTYAKQQAMMKQGEKKTRCCRGSWQQTRHTK